MNSKDDKCLNLTWLADIIEKKYPEKYDLKNLTEETLCFDIKIGYRGVYYIKLVDFGEDEQETTIFVRDLERGSLILDVLTDQTIGGIEISKNIPGRQQP